MRTEKDINLLPGWKHNFKAKWLASAALGLIVIVLLLFFTLVNPNLQIKRLRDENIKINEEISSLKYVSDMLAAFESKQKLLQDREGFLGTVQKEKLKVVDFLQQLKMYLPENVYVTRISVNTGNIYNISFVSPGPVDTARLIVKLRGIFDNPEINNISLENKNTMISLTLSPKVK